MSAVAEGASPTRTAPPRRPDGFWLAHPRYRSYVLFGATGLVLALDALIFLGAVRALGRGPDAWGAFLGAFRGAPAIVAVLLLLLGTVFFSVRWLRVGVKVATVRVGVLPAPPAPLILVAHFAGLVVVTALVLLILGGVVL